MSFAQGEFMFDTPVLARPGDPGTSHDAAEDLVSSGQRERDMRAALEFLKEHPGVTSHEMEAEAGVRDGKFRKRLAELRRKGLARTEGVRRDPVSGKNCQLWFAV